MIKLFLLYAGLVERARELMRDDRGETVEKVIITSAVVVLAVLVTVAIGNLVNAEIGDITPP